MHNRFIIFYFIIVVTIFLFSCTKDEELPSLNIELSPILDTSENQRVFTTFDGKELGYVAYENPSVKSEIAMIYLHGVESHAGWFKIASELLQQQGYDVFCLDRRGSGINRENRNFETGHVDSYETLFSDIQTFIESLQSKYKKIILVGLSWGGKLALSYGLTYPNDIDALVLITPGISAKVDVTFFEKLQILVGTFIYPTLKINSPIEDEMFTNSPKFLKIIRNDPLKIDAASARFYFQSARLDRYVDRNVTNNQLPTMLVLAMLDPIIDNDRVVEILAKSAKPVTTYMYSDQKHSVQFDAPEKLVKDIDTWLESISPQKTVLQIH